MKKWIITAALVALTAATALTAVSSAVATSDTAKPYLGVWTARMSKAQLINLGLVDPRFAGTWKLVLSADGTYKTFNPLDKWSNGTFTASGHRIVFGKDDVGCVQAGFDKKGFYRWSVKGGELRLVTVRSGSDPCGGRWETLASPVWTK